MIDRVTIKYPYVIITKDKEVYSRHKTAKAAFNKAKKLRSRFEPHAVMQLRSNDAEVGKGETVSQDWIKNKADRVGYNVLDDTTTIIEFGWY